MIIIIFCNTDFDGDDYNTNEVVDNDDEGEDFDEDVTIFVD